MSYRSTGQSGGKRIRTGYARVTAGVRGRRATVRRRMFPSSRTRGFTRTTGFFGRFQPTGPELKFLDTSVVTGTVAQAGVIVSNSLNVVPQGASESQRIGRLICIKKLYIRGQFILPSTSTVAAAFDNIRVMVYLDKQCNGAAATVGALLATDPLAASVSINSMRNLENASRFTVLYDKTFTVNAQVEIGTVTGAASRYMKLFKKCSIPIEYDSSASTGAIGTIRSNNIGVLAISESGAVTFNWLARIRYSDE